VSTIVSARPMLRRPHEYATRLIASVALRTWTISCASGALMKRAILTRDASYAAVASSPVV
jgi:hypothetical protein